MIPRVSNSGLFSTRVIWLSYVGLLSMACLWVTRPRFAAAIPPDGDGSGASPAAGLVSLVKFQKAYRQQTDTTTVHPNTGMQTVRLQRWRPSTDLVEELGKDLKPLRKVGFSHEQHYTVWHVHTAQNVLYTRKSFRTWCLVRWELVGIWTGFMIVGSNKEG